MVNSLENLKVQLPCGGRIERNAQSHEGVSKTLHTDTDGTMAHVRTTSFRDRVVIDVDDPIEVERNDLGNIMKFLEVILVVRDK